MKIKNLLVGAMSLCALAASADGYHDGIEYYKAGQYDNARTILERTINDSGTDKAMSYYYLGQIDLTNGETAKAKANFDKGIAANAENPYNYVGLGALELKNGQAKAAETYFKEAQKYGKKNHEVTVDIARAYYNADPVKYDATIQKYLDKAHKDSKNQEPSIYILEGDMRLASRDVGGAAGKYEQAITFDTDNPEGYVKYANAYIYVNPQFAVSKLEELLQRQPNSALAQRELAEKYYNTKQWTKAAQQYGKYIQNPNHFPEDKARYSVLLFASGEYANSLQVANELLAEDPTDFQMQRVRMLDLNAMEQFDQANAAAESFFALTPTGNAKFMPNDYMTYANILNKLDKADEAVVAMEKAVEVDPENADLWNELSGVYSKAKRAQDAANAFEKYLQYAEKPNLTDYYTASARYLLAAGAAGDNKELRDINADKGIEAVTRVIEGAASPAPDYYIRLGRFYIVKNDNKPDQNAVDVYKKVIELLDATPDSANPANPKNGLKNYIESYRNIGYYYQLNDMTEDQNEAYKKLDEYTAILNGTAAQ